MFVVTLTNSTGRLPQFNCIFSLFIRAQFFLPSYSRPCLLRLVRQRGSNHARRAKLVRFFALCCNFGTLLVI